MVNVKLIETPVNLGSFVKKLTQLARKRVLVGVTQDTNSRPPQMNSKIDNAELLYILSHGVRKKSMREEMQPKLDAGMKYSVAHSLYIQEHGSPLWQIPPRPVLEPAIKANKETIAKYLKEAMTSAIDGNMQQTENWMHKAGIAAEHAAYDWFEDPRNKWPPNAPSTIRQKGSALPMVDTNEMRKAITHVIREE